MDNSRNDKLRLPVKGNSDEGEKVQVTLNEEGQLIETPGGSKDGSRVRQSVGAVEGSKS